MDAADFSLLNDYQRDFPLCSRPYRAIARDLALTETEVLHRLSGLSEAGAVRRIGAIFRPGAIGAGTLAAMAVPDEQLADVVSIVNAHQAVNHNYEREHCLNLWFVATAINQGTLHRVLSDIETRCRLPVLRFALIEPYHIDLAFDLCTGLGRREDRWGKVVAGVTSEEDWRIIGALELGLPLSPEPFAWAAKRAGIPESRLLKRLANWREQGIVRRFGVIVCHHALGYRANAMAVWDIPDDKVGMLGRAIAQEPGINLCYRRERQAPQWPFNLYCMIHGQSRDSVSERISRISSRWSLNRYAREVLFTRQRFKQTGARYAFAELPA